MSRFWIFFFAVGGLALSLEAQEEGNRVDYYSPGNLLHFADHLFASGDYLRAAGEYRRFFFAAPDSAWIIGRIARCYQLGGHPEQALRVLEQLSSTPASLQPTALQYEIACTFSFMGRYEKSLAYIDTAFARQMAPGDRWRFEQLTGFNYLQQRRWSEAYRTFASLAEASADEVIRRDALRFARYALRGERLPRKKPLFAGALSTLVPGAGKIYAGYSTDGLYSLLTIGLLGWLASDGFHRDGPHSAKGWIFAPLAGVFHLGNIYGSVIAARIHNRDLERGFLTELSLPLSR